MIFSCEFSRDRAQHSALYHGGHEQERGELGCTGIALKSHAELMQKTHADSLRGRLSNMSIQEAAMPANQFLHALGFERCLKQHPFLKIILPLIVELLGQITSNLDSDM